MRKNKFIKFDQTLLKRLLNILTQNPIKLVLAIIFMILFSFFNTVPAWLIKDIADSVDGGEKITTFQFFQFGLFIIGLYCLKGMSYFGQNFFMSTLGQSVLHNLREKLYHKLVHLPLNFFNKNPGGHIINRFTTDLQTVDQAIYVAISGPLRDIPQIIILMGIMLYRSWEMFLVTIIIIPITIKIISYFTKQNTKVTSLRLSKFDELINIITETVNGIRIIKSFGMERYEITRFFSTNGRVFQFFRQNYIISSYSTPSVELVGACAMAAVLVYGGYLFNEDQWTKGEFVSYLLSFFMLGPPIKKLNGCLLKISDAMVAAGRIFKILDEKNPILDNNPKAKLPLIKESIRISINNFAYDKDTVLKGIDLDIKANQMVALVGSSGCGKTTIVNLLPRFYDLTKEQGTIYIDGKDIRKFDVQSLREQIAMVTQETILFNDTVMNNIRYGNPESNDDAVIAAASTANALKFIEDLPDKFQQSVGEKGYSLSGGEKQRIAIARALIKDSPILILDEATSNLDNESENEVQKAIDNLHHRKTTLIIAHRLSTIKKADLICVMKDGRIIDQGTHHELLQREGEYKRLYDIQFIE